MSESLLSRALAPVVSGVIVAALTLIGTSYQQSNAADRSEKERFCSDATQTFQETIALLDEGYLALQQLRLAASDRAWEQISPGPWTEYMEFHRRWNQRLIAQYFKVERYFGTRMARRLIDLEFEAPPGGVQTENPRQYSFEALAKDIETSIRLTSANQTVMNDSSNRVPMSDYIAMMKRKSEHEGTTSELLAQYKRASIATSRDVNAMLTQLGAKQVVVQPATDR